MSVEIITSFDQQCDASGDPMSGAKIYVYDVGTTTLRNVYAASDLSGSAAANPIICDAAGRHDMRYTATGSYKIVVKTSADVTVYTRDNIDGRVPVGSGALAVANGGTGATTGPAALVNLGAAADADLTVLSAEIAALSGSLASSEKTHIATGTTAQRPVSPIEGDIRRNTTVPQWEGYIVSWLKFLTEADLTSQAVQETGTALNSVVVSGLQHFNPRHAKAVVNFNGTGTPANAVGTGVSAPTDMGAGDYLLNWTVAFSTVNYITNGSASTSAAGDACATFLDRSTAGALVTPTASVQRINVATLAGVLTDVARIYVVAHGDFA